MKLYSLAIAATLAVAAVAQNTPYTGPVVDIDPQVRQKVLIVSVGQSNNGLLTEPTDVEWMNNPISGRTYSQIELDKFAIMDAPDARIKELSGSPGASSTFQFPAQDDAGGICMRLWGAKSLLRKFSLGEVTVYAGAVGSSSLAVGANQWESPTATSSFTGAFTQRVIDDCTAFMNDNPDYQLVFWCSLGATDARNGMTAETYKTQLAALASKLRNDIPGGQGAMWVQADMPADLVNLFQAQAVFGAQQDVTSFIPNSAPVTMNDQQVYDGIHITREGLRTLGMRMAVATQLQ